MFDIDDFLDRAKKAAGVTSDYALGVKVLGFPKSTTVTNWRSGRSMPDERSILKLCELTGDNPFYVATMIQSMRAANDDAAGLWRQLADQVKKGSKAVLMTAGIAVILSAALPSEALAFTGNRAADGSALLIMSNALRRFGIRLLALMAARRRLLALA